MRNCGSVMTTLLRWSWTAVLTFEQDVKACPIPQSRHRALCNPEERLLDSSCRVIWRRRSLRRVKWLTNRQVVSSYAGTACGPACGQHLLLFRRRGCGDRDPVGAATNGRASVYRPAESIGLTRRGWQAGRLRRHPRSGHCGHRYSAAQLEGGRNLGMEHRLTARGGRVGCCVG
jgi:hypothetical protein